MKQEDETPAHYRYIIKRAEIRQLCRHYVSFHSSSQLAPLSTRNTPPTAVITVLSKLHTKTTLETEGE